MATSLAVPVAYITVLVTALAIFSRVYRKRKAAEKRAYDSWFPSHPARDIYMTLLSSSTEVPDSLLKSALLTRATADVKRIWRIREDKMALTSLHQRGLLGDETLARFEAAEKELEAEIVDVVQEANSFNPNWGSMIFATATEAAQAERTREVVINIGKVKAEEDKRQERRRKFVPDTTPAVPAIAPSTPAPAIRAPEVKGSAQRTPASASASAVAAKASPTASGSGSRSGSPGPEALLNAVASGSGTSTPAGTPSKSASGKKKKGKK